MRTTVTLDPDVSAHVHRVMRERGITFKEALHAVLRRGLGLDEPAERVVTPTFSLGEPSVPLDGALRLAADLEDDELARRLARGT
jgi:hypothetical protein